MALPPEHNCFIHRNRHRDSPSAWWGISVLILMVAAISIYLFAVPSEQRRWQYSEGRFYQSIERLQTRR